MNDDKFSSPAPGVAATNVLPEMASVTVSSRIPEFWTDQPRLWFVQCEAILTPQKLSDEAKFNLLVTKLGKEVIQQVSDILLQPPQSRRFEALKARLLTVYEESENRQLQKLLSEIELGDQKPSQLLRRMRDLARGKIPDDTLSIMWQGHLPASVRGVLAVTDVKDLENLAIIADKILETMRPVHVSEVANHTSILSQPSTSNDMSVLQAQIAQLILQVMELQNSRRPISKYRYNNSYHRRYRSGSRQRNTTRGRSNSAERLCFYHRKFRHRANKCTEPCAWRNMTSDNQEN